MNIRFITWYGGKYRVIFQLLCLICWGSEIWIEPFMGSAAVTLNKARHPIEVINDLDGTLTSLFCLMANKEKGKELLERLLKLKYSEQEFIRAKLADKNNFRGLDEFTKAELTFILITQSFNSTKENWRKGITQDEYSSILHKNLKYVHDRLQNVKVTNIDAMELIAQYVTNEKAFMLLDPPYCHELRGKNATNVYKYEMDLKKQIIMLELIKNARCKMIVCGYRNKNGPDLYDNYLLNNGWNHYKLADLKKSCQTKIIKDTAEEWVWLNYDPPQIAKYYINLSSKDWK